jgi:hypothetical protein
VPCKFTPLSNSYANGRQQAAKVKGNVVEFFAEYNQWHPFTALWSALHRSANIIKSLRTADTRNSKNNPKHDVHRSVILSFL